MSYNIPAPRLPSQVARPAGGSLGLGQPVTNGPNLRAVSINGSTARTEKGKGWDKGSDVVVANNLQVTNYNSALTQNVLLFTENDKYNSSLMLNDPRSQVHTQKPLHEFNLHLFNAHRDPKLQTAESIMDRWPVAGMVQTTTAPDAVERKSKPTVGVTVIPKGPAQAFDVWTGAQGGQTLFIVLQHFDMLSSPQYDTMSSSTQAKVRFPLENDEDTVMGAAARFSGSGASGYDEKKALDEYTAAEDKAKRASASYQRLLNGTGDEKASTAQTLAASAAAVKASEDRNKARTKYELAKKANADLKKSGDAKSSSASSSSSSSSAPTVKPRKVGGFNAIQAMKEMDMYEPDETERGATSFQRSIIPRTVVLRRQEEKGYGTQTASTGFWQVTTYVSPNGAPPPAEMMIHRTEGGIFVGLYRKIGVYSYRFMGTAGTENDQTAITRFMHPKDPQTNLNANLASLPSCMIMMSL